MLTRVWAGSTRPNWTVTVVRHEPAPAQAEPVNGLSDAELVTACLAGQRDAFDLIVERHRRSVYKLCYRFVGNHEDASDLSQEVFLRAYRGLKGFKGHSALATWLYRIGVNTCLNRVSGNLPVTEPLDARPHQAVGDDPAVALIKDERRARVRAAIARLPRKQRATLILRAYQELSHREIADILGSSVGAVKANFFHALGNLKKFLEGQY
jgi:RNA polymerase sigma-70 factor (ECF subfamily)